MQKNIKYKIGDIICIPLSDTLYAFARIFNDASIGVYNVVSENILQIDKIIKNKIAFYPGVFDTAIENGSWKIIGHLQFNNEEESWPPPKYIQDIINPNKFRIYFKGEMKDASKKDVEGLEQQKMYKPEQLIKMVIDNLVNK